MDRFPESYDSPRLLTLNEGLRNGWIAACTAGNQPSSPPCSVGVGPTATPGNGDGRGFIDPEIIQGSL